MENVKCSLLRLADLKVNDFGVYSFEPKVLHPSACARLGAVTAGSFDAARGLGRAMQDLRFHALSCASCSGMCLYYSMI